MGRGKFVCEGSIYVLSYIRPDHPSISVNTGPYAKGHVTCMYMIQAHAFFVLPDCTDT